MSEELEKLLADDQKKDQTASGDKTSEQKKDEELKSKETQLANINKAIAEANEQLKKSRQAKKSGSTEEIEEEIPKIDFNDRGAKAWGKHISDEVNPLKEEMAKEKEEIRTYAIKEFLSDKPELAKDPEKMKRVMGMYEKIRTATEKNVPGVMLDLRKAYAAEFADEIIEGNQNDRIDRARGKAIFSDIGISRGATSFREEREADHELSRDDEAILSKWGMTSKEWVDMKKKQKNQKKE